MRSPAPSCPADENTSAALAIADDLAASAIWSSERCVFVGAVAPEAPGAPVPYASTGADVYEGTAGIARFLSLAARLSGEPSHRRTACGALEHAMATCEGTSLFSGQVGVALVALESGMADLAARGDRLLEQGVSAVLADPAPAADLLSGIAGVVLGLVALQRRRPEPRWQDALEALGERLLELAVTDAHGLKWPVVPGGEEHLCGLAHGASGIALAMERLASVSPDGPRWSDVARRARDFERQYYSVAHGSWADLRRDEAESPADDVAYPHMWCHGSIGIAAERLGAHSSDRLARADKLAAIDGARTYLRQVLRLPRGAGGGDAVNGSCCHGLSGAADLMIDCAMRDGNPDHWLGLARAAARAVRDDARRAQGWRCGLPGGHYSPGLMLGVAGIGWTLLRVAHPAAVPSAWRLGEMTSAALGGAGAARAAR